jgi:hypothetical protein
MSALYVRQMSALSYPGGRETRFYSGKLNFIRWIFFSKLPSSVLARFPYGKAI